MNNPEVRVACQPTYIDEKTNNLVNMPGMIIDRLDPAWHGQPYSRVQLENGQKLWIQNRWLTFQDQE